jgi:HlyD family secretion protein
LTANLKFEVGRRPDALLVPNAALRWQPTPEQVPAAHRRSLALGKKSEPGRGLVWFPTGDVVRPIEVQLGLSNADYTEVLGGDLTEGTEVVTNDAQVGSGGDSASNPFAPRPWVSKKKE